MMNMKAEILNVWKVNRQNESAKFYFEREHAVKDSLGDGFLISDGFVESTSVIKVTYQDKHRYIELNPDLVVDVLENSIIDENSKQALIQSGLKKLTASEKEALGLKGWL